MYYAYPNETEAYLARQQYMLGSDILVAPIYEPRNASGLASISVWIPPQSAWVDWKTGRAPMRAEADGYWVERAYPIENVPVFVRQGALLPLFPRQLVTTPGYAARAYERLEVSCRLCAETTCVARGKVCLSPRNYGCEDGHTLLLCSVLGGEAVSLCRGLSPTHSRAATACTLSWWTTRQLHHLRR